MSHPPLGDTRIVRRVRVGCCRGGRHLGRAYPPYDLVRSARAEQVHKLGTGSRGVEEHEGVGEHHVIEATR
jgi:hypothetical protein